MNPETAKLEEVALALRGRRLRDLLESFQQLRRDLLAVRRSRRQRAKLLRLVRRHGLRLCLKRLRDPGMVIYRDAPRCYVHYEVHATRYYREQLQTQRTQFKQCWKRLKQENVQPILANLAGLYTEAELVNGNSYRVRWILPNVELEGVWIGDLEVELTLDTFKVKVWNLSIDTEEKGGHPHPHVSGSGEICWNGYHEEAETYHRAGEFLALKDLIDNLLQTYNPESPYINLEDWENGFGASCSVCGDRFSEDELSWSEACEGDLCESCRAWCDHCQDYVHYTDYNCDLEACEKCIENDAEPCHWCGQRFWTEDLIEVEVAWFTKKQVIAVCADCKQDNDTMESVERKEQYNEKNRETLTGHDAGEDHTDAIRVLAPAMDVPANPQ